jgi:phosphoglycolate phosphatase
MLLAALERLGITSGEAVYVGDSEVDIETAKNTGVDCISVTWGFRDRDWLIGHGAGIIIDYPEEILSLL